MSHHTLSTPRSAAARRAAPVTNARPAQERAPGADDAAAAPLPARTVRTVRTVLVAACGWPGSDAEPPRKTTRRSPARG